MNNNLNNKLNEYIDGNLTAQELLKLKEKILNDNEVLEKLNGLKTVDRILRKLEVEAVPDGFTEMTMRKIYASSAIKSTDKNYFFISVVSFLTFSILSFIGYAIFTAQYSFGVVIGSKTLNEISISLSKYYSGISNILFTGISRDIFGAIIFIIILSFCFVVISHKKFMAKLNTANG